MIDINHFLSSVKNIADSNPTYRTGGRGADGTCDCIGLIMGAMYENGQKAYPLHSTNYFARFEMTALNALTNENQLSPGMIVYKAREDNGQLNDRYKQGGRYYVPGDLMDYYHVGVVTSVSPLEITHCTETSAIDGIAYDSSIRGWTHYGTLNDIDYAVNGGEEMETVSKLATVTSPNGKPVNLRKGPGTNYTYIAKVPIGTVVTVHGGNDEWMQVSTGGKTGYMMTSFLMVEKVDEAPQETPQEDQQGGYSEGFEEKVLSMLEAIIDNLNAMGGVG